jgi:pyridoxamine 5'-phosphate oxidase
MFFKYFSTIREVCFLVTHPRLWWRSHLTEESVPSDPFELFACWYDDAKRSNWLLEFPNALVLSTVSEMGEAQGRVVLMKGFDSHGIVFYTNYDSAKGHAIAHNQNVALTFYWGNLQRQVRITGLAHKVSAEESDNYFFSRPYDSQLGAWASGQSQVLKGGRKELLDAFNYFKQKFQHEPITRPPHWGGYRVVPYHFEFWQLCLSRLHDRLHYVRSATIEEVPQLWHLERLSP